MAPLGNFDRQRLHVQHHGRADFSEIANREDVLRSRGINFILGLIALVCLGFTVVTVRFAGFNEPAIWALVIGSACLLILLYRLGFLKKRRSSRKSSSKKKHHSKHKSGSRHRSHSKKRHGSRHKRRRK
jgi:ABC-type nickel/cobalt efflux system permease component RcnA